MLTMLAAALLPWLSADAALPGGHGPDHAAHRTTTAASRAAVAPPLDTILERAGRYVSEFQDRFTQLVGFERYRQEVHGPQGGDLIDLESEIFLIRLDPPQPSLTVRHVLTVNGRSVASSSDSVIELLADRRGGARLRELADASSRFNIGNVQRNFNHPTLALLFLAPDSQSRFRFSHDGRVVVDGTEVNRIGFSERQRPTLIRDARSRRDAPSSGVLLITDDGRVLQTELRVQVPKNTSSMIRVTYGEEPRLQTMVPLLMEEEHRTARRPRGGEMITGRATYSNFRRFETGGRILAPAAPDPD